MRPTDEVGDGENIFVNWHIFTLEGTVPRNLKKILDLIWNTNTNYFYDVLRPIEDKFHLKYVGRRISLYQDIIFFMNKETQTHLILMASKIQGFSLKDIAAAKISSQLNTVDDGRLIISQGLVPASLKDLIPKYL